MSSEKPLIERVVFQDRYFAEEEIANTYLKRLEEAMALPYSEEQRSRIMAETVFVSAHVSRETAYLQLLAEKGNQKTALDGAKTLVDRLEVSTKSLTEQIKDFTMKADEGTRLLAKWTMWLAFATIFLVLATGGLVYVEWSHSQETPRQAATR